MKKQSKTNIENKIEATGFVVGAIGFVLFIAENNSQNLAKVLSINLIGLSIMGMAFGLFQLAKIIRKEKYEQNRFSNYRTRRYGRN